MPYIITNSSFLPKTPPDLIGPEALLLNSHHLKIQESIYDCLFLSRRTIRNFSLSISYVVVFPFLYSKLALYLCYIWKEF